MLLDAEIINKKHFFYCTLHMGQITKDGDIAKKGSLFLELWAIIVATLKGVESKPRCFLASFC